MRYSDFEHVMSTARMSRYLQACNSNTLKAMTLYRRNLKLSQELFTIISCFEVALRNKIDEHYLHRHSSDWLRGAVAHGGIFANRQCRVTASTIRDEISNLGNRYSHAKLVAALGFGFWRYLFSNHQYRAGGQSLIQIFPQRPPSSARQHYNASFVFHQLKLINHIRNRIAHHEPICFVPRQPIKDTQYAREHYQIIQELFQWMAIDETSLLYGLDHIEGICNEIDSL